jgi:hypothetical protein
VHPLASLLSGAAFLLNPDAGRAMILQRLAADTHWTGDGARLEAELLATHVREVLGGNSLEPKRNYRRAETAGLIANLAFELHAPLSSVVNDGGASTLVRQELARNLEILKGKRLVIWAFAERDLRFGMKSWRRSRSRNRTPSRRFSLPWDCPAPSEPRASRPCPCPTRLRRACRRGAHTLARTTASFSIWRREWRLAELTARRQGRNGVDCHA